MSFKFNPFTGTFDLDTQGGGGPGASSLGDLTDVTISSPLANQVLLYNGLQWVNAPSPGGNYNLDGGFAASLYLPSQMLNGGGANG